MLMSALHGAGGNAFAIVAQGTERGCRTSALSAPP
jgi:hypothetical protein